MSQSLPIHTRITCPHCWHVIHPADFLWISQSYELRGDSRLGREALKRFLPSRFDHNGFAIDEMGARCESIACPDCHLPVPRILVETWPLFISILGSPSSGKSYFLASSIWQTRQQLYKFNVGFVDADPVANQIISEYEKKLFLNESPEDLVAIKKTEEDGELYQFVDYGTRQEMYPRPFVYAMRPDTDHPLGMGPDSIMQHSRAVCLYDNAGEHFLPNLQSQVSPATSHLALSKALIFVFDPLQHPRFRQLCREHSNDPQLEKGFTSHRQDEILQEAAKRIRLKANLGQNEKFNRPLIVVVNKYDVWRKLLPKMNLEKGVPFVKTKQGLGINQSMVEMVSGEVQKLLASTSPETVAACKSFCDDVTFIPASPMGGSPEKTINDEVVMYGVRPKNLKPIWSEVPLLYAMAKSRSSLLPLVRKEP